MTRSNSLPMYDFPEVQTSTKAILDALSNTFTKLGDVSQPAFPESSIHADLMRMWKDDSTLFSQSCGLPFVEDLHDYVDIIATLKWTGISDERGWYRTVIVAREELGVASLSEVGGMQPVITNQQSLPMSGIRKHSTRTTTRCHLSTLKTECAQCLLKQNLLRLTK